MGENDKLIELSENVSFQEVPTPKDRKDFTYKDIQNFYARVMSCLGMSQSALKPEELDYPENAPTAERRVKSLIPNWAELDNDKFGLFESCIVFMTCFIMCPLANQRRISQQTTPSLTLKFSDSAVQPTRCDHYLDLLNELASEILEEETDSFFGFRVTKSSDCRRYVFWNQ